MLGHLQSPYIKTIKKNLLKLQTLVVFCIAGTILQRHTAQAQEPSQIETFIQNLETTGRDIDTLVQQPSISRYDITRLLNAAQCNDCTNPNQLNINQRNQERRDTFSSESDNNFGDIKQANTIYQQSNYYYCVANVGNRGFMNGYPEATSPICGGNFCGNNNITNAEFFQVLINISAQFIAKNHKAQRETIQQRTQQQTADDLVSKGRDESDQARTNLGELRCGSQECPLQSSEELQTYLKYCRFNISQCDMHPYPGIQEGARPIAELNILEKNKILTTNTTQENASTIHSLTSAQTAIQAFANIFDIIQCTPNHDYDCDSITNTQDNCPETYNPSQKNYDQDKRGDVCDQDIDNDGITNPKGIVDESGNIVISILNQSENSEERDQCLFDKSNTQPCNAQQNQGLAITINNLNSIDDQHTITASAISNQSTTQVQRQSSDGYHYKGQKMQHTFTTPGAHRLYASIPNTNKQRKPEAFSTIYIPNTQQQSVFQSRIDKYNQSSLHLIKQGTNTDNNKNETIKTFLNSDPIKTSDHIIIDASRAINTITVQKTRNSQVIAINETAHITITDINNEEKNQTYILNLFIDEKVEKGKTFTINSSIQQRPNSQIISSKWIVDQEEVSTISTDTKEIQWKFDDNKSHVIQQQVILNDGNSVQASVSIQADNNAITDLLIMTSKPEQRTIQHTGTNISYIDSHISINTVQTSAENTHLFKDNNRTIGIIEIPPISPTSIDLSSPEPGLHIRSHSIIIDECTQLHSANSVVNTLTEICLNHYTQNKSGLLCDMDKDTIPDICDDDIDGDGSKNMIGLIIYETTNCSISSKNINKAYVQQEDRTEHTKRRGFNNLSCQLDNCPFTINSDQKDKNNDGQGDICQGLAQKLSQGETIQRKKDSQRIVFTGSFRKTIADFDLDGIPDESDICPGIPENYNGKNDKDGCPEINENNNCQSGSPITFPLPQLPKPPSDPSPENPNNPDPDDPDKDTDEEDKEDNNDDHCKEPYPDECLCRELTTEQCCLQHGLDCPDDDDDPSEDDNLCLHPPYGTECLCFGLTQAQCNDHCQEPYPDECLCKDLTTEQCCLQHGLDCPDDDDDPSENDNLCLQAPYGTECLCFGLTQTQCCQQHAIDCPNNPDLPNPDIPVPDPEDPEIDPDDDEDDHCQEPYPDECLCRNLTTEQCCLQHALDCPDDDDDPSENDNLCLQAPYGTECLCFGLTQTQCCQQHAIDCPNNPDLPNPDIPVPDPEDPEIDPNPDPEDDEEDDDYCQEPYPNECVCRNISTEECCEQFGLDCPSDDDDPSENDNFCLQEPFGSECLCFGLTADQCCQEYQISCPSIETSCQENPYGEDCICFELTQQECCLQQGTDCPNTGNPSIEDPITDDTPIIEVINCSMCPCQYVDFQADITENMLIRAQLLQKEKKSVYSISTIHTLP